MCEIIIISWSSVVGSSSGDACTRGQVLRPRRRARDCLERDASAPTRKRASQFPPATVLKARSSKPHLHTWTVHNECAMHSCRSIYSPEGRKRNRRKPSLALIQFQNDRNIWVSWGVAPT